MQISVNEKLVGKLNIDRDVLGYWPTREMSATELAHWSYIQHKAVCGAILSDEKYEAAYPDPQERRRHSQKQNQFVVSGEVIIADYDAKDLAPELKANMTIEKLLENEFVKKHCFLIKPSSGYNSESKPNYHLFFRLDTPITDANEFRPIMLALYAHLPPTPDPAMAKASQYVAGTYFTDPGLHERGYFLSDLYICDDAEPVPIAQLRAELPQDQVIRLKKAAQVRDNGEKYGTSVTGSRRVEQHFKQTEDKREATVIECLSYILDAWESDAPYDLWMRLWMSAHHGSPTNAVAQYISEHPRLWVGRSHEDKQDFYKHFIDHKHRDVDGITVATLFYMARQAGWLAQTGVEIPAKLALDINVRYVSDWLDTQATIPPRVMMQSQTGSGKTQTFIQAYRRLGKPKSVLFVPTVKLALELTTTLQKANLPAVCYHDQKTGKSIDRDLMLDAPILVSTLQTFALKLKADMRQYGLVWIEESDQILSGFARASLDDKQSGVFRSHVSNDEAVAGFAVLRDALENAGVVWCLDATMTQITYRLMRDMCKQPFLYVHNIYNANKAPVVMIDDVEYIREIAYNALAEGKTVAIVCDTINQALLINDLLRTVRVIGDWNSICIVKDTERQPRVQAFMSDVNEGAKKYRCVIYNSVMGSGVSITSVRPDVVIQIATYLAPRHNLQLLNRFRDQGKVYCYYAGTEDYYAESAEQIKSAIQRRIELEAELVAVPLAMRTSDAALQHELATLSIADDRLQQRSPRDFYEGLLIGDGRTVHDYNNPEIRGSLTSASQAIKDAKKAERERLRAEWPTVPPIDREHPAKSEYTPFQVQLGVYHAEIARSLRNNIPEDVDPTYIAKVVDEFGSHSYMIEAFLMQDVFFVRSEGYLADAGRALSSVKTNVARLKAITLARHILPSFEDKLTTAELNERAPLFLREVTTNREFYDMAVTRDTQYHTMVDRFTDSGQRAYAMTKALLKPLGLKLKQTGRQRKGEAENFIYSVENIQQFHDFIAWRGYQHTTGSEMYDFEKNAAKRAFVRELFAPLTMEQRHKALHLRTIEKYTTIEMAVATVLGVDIL